MYKKDLLKDYIQNSSLRIYKEKIYVRLSDNLAENYDKGIYNMWLEHICNCYNQLISLNLTLPNKSNPNLYIYIVPDDNYTSILSYPEKYNNGSGWWRPVNCYDLDWYKTAFWTSQNCCLWSEKLNQFRKIENSIHELSHIICSQFGYKCLTISEWLAETIPLYILNYEEKFINHKFIISKLNPEDILSVKELIDSEKDDSFWRKYVTESKHCSFRYSYISSYLFIRWYLGIIEKNKGLSKIWALQYFLELLKNTKLNNERLIEYLADEIWIDSEILLNWKEMQINTALSIKDSN